MKDGVTGSAPPIELITWCPVCEEFLDVRSPARFTLMQDGRRLALCELCTESARAIQQRDGRVDVWALARAQRRLDDDNCSESYTEDTDEILRRWDSAWGPRPDPRVDDDEAIFQQWEHGRLLAFYACERRGMPVHCAISAHPSVP